ncbi:MAG: hypothetical protein JO112_14765 [Planctomycetes bacterium]|nr:hypothetical protein [Planctomycetota bacterium]
MSQNITEPKPSALGGILGGIFGALGAALTAGIFLFVAGGVISVRVDEAQGHPGGESDAGFIALFTLLGSVGIALLFSVLGGVIGALAGISKAPRSKWIGWGALIGGALAGLGHVFLLSGWLHGGMNLGIWLAVIGAGTLAGVVAGAIAGTIGCVVGAALGR